MNKIFVSVGLAAVGTASLQTSSALALDVQSPKLWNVSASLRGFYDDNYDTLANKSGSFGAELSPQIMFSIPMQQTEFGMRYTYGLYYYQDRQSRSLNPFDQSHQVDLWVDHSFTERWEAKLSDTLAIGQEPELIQGGTPYRINGNNIANTVTLGVHTDWTRLFSTQLTFSDRIYSFENSGATTADLFPNGTTTYNYTFNGNPYFFGPVTGTGQGASLAGTLDRLENSGALDLQWHVGPETMLFAGYQYQQVNYTGNEPIAFSPQLAFYTQNLANIYYYSSSRDNRSHYGYLGLQETLLANLNFTGKAGVQYVTDYNDPLSSASVSPYVSLSLIYTYLPGSYAQFGFNHGQNATDVVAVQLQQGLNQFGRLTQAQESSTFYVSINHRITAKLLGTVIANYQYSDYTSGAYTSAPDKDFNLGLNLKYSINQHFSAEIGYNYDNLQSGIDSRGYNRNRIYLGLGAAY